MKIKIKYFLIAIFLILFLFAFWQKRTNDEFRCTDCNVVFIVINALRYDHLSSAGYFRNTSKTIDNLDNTIFFENAYSNSPAIIGRMSLFTGLYPHNHKILIKNTNSLEPNISTMGQFFKLNGYRTVFFGPFDNDDMNLSAGFNRGFDELHNPGLNANSTVEWIENNSNQKFFIYFHTFVTHAPYFTYYNSDNKFSDNYSGNMIGSYDKLYRIMFQNITKMLAENPDEAYRIFGKENILNNIQLFTGNYSFDKVDAWDYINATDEGSYFRDGTFWNSTNLTDINDISHLEAMYDSRIVDADLRVAKIIDAVNRMNLSSKTVIVITSDHGEEFMDHDQIDHNSLFDEIIHIPLVIKIPNTTAIKTDKIVQEVDILPTVLGIVGIKTSYVFDGHDILHGYDNQYTFGEFYGWYRDLNNPVYNTSYVRTKEWKILILPNGTRELFNIINDKHETKNLYYINSGISNDLSTMLKKIENS